MLTAAARDAQSEAERRHRRVLHGRAHARRRSRGRPRPRTRRRAGRLRFHVAPTRAAGSACGGRSRSRAFALMPGRALGGHAPVRLVAGLPLVVALRVPLLDAGRVRRRVRRDVGLADFQIRHRYLILSMFVVPSVSAGRLCGRRSSASKKRPISSHTSLPPVSPLQRLRIRPDQPVALVDRHEPVVARSPRAIDEQRLDVGLHASRAPGWRPRSHCQASSSQQGLRRAHRPGIERHHPLGGRAVEEERHVHRDVQLLPRLDRRARSPSSRSRRSGTSR